MRIRRLFASVLAMLAGVAFLAVPAKPAGAASVIATAWWYRADTATPTAGSPQPIPGGDPVLPVTPPGPPTVGEDQLYVEGTATTATAIAGITLMLAEGESGPVLTIEPAASSAVPPNAVILACRAAIEWTPPESSPGTWESKPLVDCSKSVQGQVVEGKIVFPLQTLVQGSLVDVVIVPGTDPTLPAGANGSTFSLAFAKPGPGAIVTTQSSEAPSFTSDFETSFDPASEAPLGDFGTVAPSLPDPVTDAPVAAPSLEPQDQAPSIPRIPPVEVAAVGDAPRTLGLLLLFAGALGAYLAANGAPRQAIGLGRFRRVLPPGSAPELIGVDPVRSADVVERGLGRLRRPRVGTPPAL